MNTFFKIYEQFFDQCLNLKNDCLMNMNDFGKQPLEFSDRSTKQIILDKKGVSF